MNPKKDGVATNEAAPAATTTATQYIEGLRRRRAAAYRVPPYRSTCSCADPWTCRCDEAVQQPSERMVDAYRDAASSLLTAGLTPAAFVPEMRQLWRRDAEQRKLARLIAERWQVAVA